MVFVFPFVHLLLMSVWSSPRASVSVVCFCWCLCILCVCMCTSSWYDSWAIGVAGGSRGWLVVTSTVAGGL